MAAKWVHRWCLEPGLLAIGAVAIAGSACYQDDSGEVGQEQPTQRLEHQLTPEISDSGRDEPTLAEALAPASMSAQPTVSRRESIGSALPPLVRIDLAEELANGATVAIVQVVGYEDISHSTEYVEPEHIHEPPPEGASDAIDEGEIPTLARFTVQVEDVLLGNVQAPPDGVAHVLQAGGYANDTAYELDSDPLLAVGSTYLVMLYPHLGPGEAYWSSPFGRFELVDGTLVATYPHLDFAPRVSDIPDLLNGLTIEEARGVIATASDGTMAESGDGREE